MNETAKCPQKSAYHNEPGSKMRIKRVLDNLEEEAKQDEKVTEATKEFAESLTLLREAYDGIEEIVDKYKEAHKNFVVEMKATAKRQWDDIKSWSDDEVPDNIAAAIKQLREGEFYEQKEESLETSKEDAEEAFHSLKSCYEYFNAKVDIASKKFDKKKEFEKTVSNWFADLATLHGEANGYKDAEKYRSVYAVRLEFEEVWNKTLELDEDSTSAKTPEWLKDELTEDLRKVITLTHDRYLWHKDKLAKEEASKAAELAKQQAFEAAEKAYKAADKNLKSFSDNRRSSFIREAQDVEPVPESTTPTVEDAVSDTPEAKADQAVSGNSASPDADTSTGDASQKP